MAQQKKVAFTIDDVPNFREYKKAGNNSVLLEKIKQANIPVTIFINEINLTRFKDGEGVQLLEQWLKDKNIDPGNHGYAHQRYVGQGFEAYKNEVVQGEVQTNILLKEGGKTLDYFRFPYNCLGEDSTAQHKIRNYLKSQGYAIAPFTIESSDYIYNKLYLQAVAAGNTAEAELRITQYLELTKNLLLFYEGLYTNQPPLDHIYLFHDNALNAACFDQLLLVFKEMGYAFVTMEEAMQNPYYDQDNYYHGPHGFSWIYRWIPEDEKRNAIMKREPWVGKKLYSLYLK